MLGLVVKKNLVIVDHAVKEHLVTTVEGNPKISTTGDGLRVTSLFTRLKASAKGRRDRNQIGDNCQSVHEPPRSQNPDEARVAPPVVSS